MLVQRTAKFGDGFRAAPRQAAGHPRFRRGHAYHATVDELSPDRDEIDDGARDEHFAGRAAEASPRESISGPPGSDGSCLPMCTPTRRGMCDRARQRDIAAAADGASRAVERGRKTMVAESRSGRDAPRLAIRERWRCSRSPGAASERPSGRRRARVRRHGRMGRPRKPSIRRRIRPPADKRQVVDPGNRQAAAGIRDAR